MTLAFERVGEFGGRPSVWSLGRSPVCVLAPQRTVGGGSKTKLSIW